MQNFYPFDVFSVEVYQDAYQHQDKPRKVTHPPFFVLIYRQILCSLWILSIFFSVRVGKLFGTKWVRAGKLPQSDITSQLSFPQRNHYSWNRTSSGETSSLRSKFPFFAGGPVTVTISLFSLASAADTDFVHAETAESPDSPVLFTSPRIQTVNTSNSAPNCVPDIVCSSHFFTSSD